MRTDANTKKGIIEAENVPTPKPEQSAKKKVAARPKRLTPAEKAAKNKSDEILVIFREVTNDTAPSIYDKIDWEREVWKSLNKIAELPIQRILKKNRFRDEKPRRGVKIYRGHRKNQSIQRGGRKPTSTRSHCSV